MEQGNEQFRMNGLIVIEHNYLEIYEYEKWSDNVIDYQFREGDEIDSILEIKEGKTIAPQLLNESELISKMDKNGIGTDSTIHEHIKKIQDREYVVKVKGRMKPTDIGIALVQSYDQLGLKMAQPEIRTNMEQDLVDIIEQKVEMQDVLGKNQQYFKKVYKEINDQRYKILEVFKKQLNMY